MNNTLKPCRACGEGSLRPNTVQDIYLYKGKEYPITLHFSECDVCGCELSDASDALKDDRAATKIRKQVDGLLTGAEVLAIRQSLGLTQAQAAKVFGGGAVAFSKYEHDDVAQSEAMDKLIRSAVEVPAQREWLFTRAGLAPLHSLEFEQVELSLANTVGIHIIPNDFIKPKMPKESVEWSMYNLTRSESPHSSSITFSSTPANDHAYQEAFYG